MFEGCAVEAGADVERFVIKAYYADDSLIGSAGNDWLDGRGSGDTYKGSSGNCGYVCDRLRYKVEGEMGRRYDLEPVR
ncbi:hypothetical protein [Aureimonas phyllosphaerae]|uniref:Ca2+-binding RTX toxin-like protein n=1 Tax=Aureimonas phyllosphaerae TaxID=1166078 RepID=A0A7W6C3Y3_9HYPH|nr:hypothetical protein [Aureimonas phyllosphaerae]MBB3938007.1 Ca2+-binding RTX toxin-like protein [Aureimonas phyllosphaerae]MBB3962014.1 Ca2+-binding RTX toxin-like protein [Aureimonas phyllosphaerae]SFF53909.1 hypothetical protein SAMN05216566_12415 [Aureimonas phyllosphaerae]